MLVRMGYSLGYAAGAPLGGLAAQAWGYAALAIGAGILMVGYVAVALFLLPNVRPAPARQGAPAARRGLPWPLLVFCLAGLLVIMGEQAKSLFLPLRITQGLHLPPADFGLLAGAQAALELLTMPLVGRLADRLGMAPMHGDHLLLAGALPARRQHGDRPAAAGRAAQCWRRPPWPASTAWPTSRRSGSRPGQEGLGISLYASSWAAATLASGLLIGATAQVVGIDAGLRLGALAALVGWVLLLVTLRAQRRPVPAPAQPAAR